MSLLQGPRVPSATRWSRPWSRGIFPVDQLKLLASTRGAGTKIEFKGKEYTVEVMTENSFAGMDIGLFSPGGSVSEKFAPIAGKAGCVVIDNTSAFRMDPQVPLVVPEVNAHAIARYGTRTSSRTRTAPRSRWS